MTRALASVERFSSLAPLRTGATSGVLFAGSIWFPPFGFLLSLASPLPIALEAWRRGFAGAGGAVAVGCFAALLIGGAEASAAYLFQFAAGGCALGTALRLGRSPSWVVGSYAAVAAAAFWGSLLWMAASSGVGPAEFLDRTLSETLDPLVAQALQNGLDAQDTLTLQTWAEQTRALLLRTLPGLHGILVLLTGWGNALVLRRLVRDTRAWHHWRAPECWIWVLIGSGLTGLIAPGGIGTAALNLFLVAVAVYFLQGLAVAQNLFEVRNFPRIFRIAAYVMLFLQLPVILLVAGVGAFDMWFDFRSRWAPPPSDAGPPR